VLFCHVFTAVCIHSSSQILLNWTVPARELTVVSRKLRGKHRASLSCISYIYHSPIYLLKIIYPKLLKQFSVLKKCQGKLDCLIHEMLFIRERKPKLSTQSNSIRAKVFVLNIFAGALIRWLTL